MTLDGCKRSHPVKANKGVTMAAKNKTPKSTSAEAADELILVEKDGQQIRIHPGTLANHKSLGWQPVGGEPVAAETEAEESSESGEKEPDPDGIESGESK
jgi:hypothetical protein